MGNNTVRLPGIGLIFLAFPVWGLAAYFSEEVFNYLFDLQLSGWRYFIGFVVAVLFVFAAAWRIHKRS